MHPGKIGLNENDSGSKLPKYIERNPQQMKDQTTFTQVAEPLQDLFGSTDISSDPFSPIECAVHDILVTIGEDPQRQGLQKTPDRVRRMYDELTAGYRTDPDKLINGALFDVEYDEMVLVKTSNFTACASITCCLSLGKRMSPISPMER